MSAANRSPLSFRVSNHDMARRSGYVSTYHLDTAVVTSNITDTLELIDYGYGAILIPTSVTSLVYYGSVSLGGSYAPIYDSAGNAVSQTVTAGRWYAIPAAAMQFPYLKIVANVAANASILLKS